jgi:hypothetical protein
VSVVMETLFQIEIFCKNSAYNLFFIALYYISKRIPYVDGIYTLFRTFV